MKLGIIDKKLSLRLADFGRYGVGVYVNPLKMKIRDENLFLDNFASSSEKLLKMMFADVKAGVKQQAIKELVATS